MPCGVPPLRDCLSRGEVSVTDSLSAALAALQATPPRIKKTARGQHGNYADLPTVTQALRPKLDKLGLLWTTRPTISADLGFHLVCTLTHIETGEDMVGYYPLGDGNPQQMGSALTYARRYALVTMTGVTPDGDDDDGHAASHAAASQPNRTRTPIPGPDHERLRYGTVERTPEDRPAERSHTITVDRWQDQPAGDFDIGQPEDRPGSIDARQLKDLGIAFTKAGITDRAVRLGMVADLIGRQVLTSKQLSRLEADHVLKALKEAADATQS